MLRYNARVRNWLEVSATQLSIVYMKENIGEGNQLTIGFVYQEDLGKVCA